MCLWSGGSAFVECTQVRSARGVPKQEAVCPGTIDAGTDDGHAVSAITTPEGRFYLERPRRGRTRSAQMSGFDAGKKHHRALGETSRSSQVRGGTSPRQSQSRGEIPVIIIAQGRSNVRPLNGDPGDRVARLEDFERTSPYFSPSRSSPSLARYQRRDATTAINRSRLTAALNKTVRVSATGAPAGRQKSQPSASTH